MMEKIRITAGKYRGRVIKSPGSLATHPMGSREKLALFNMVAGDLANEVVLDAFAGSGALGIEALSRGALKVVFVEKNAGAVRTIRENLVSLGITSAGEVIFADVMKLSSREKFGVVFADPPYDKFDESEVASLAKWVKEGGILVLSHPGQPLEIPGFLLEKTRKYARARISIYRFTGMGGART